MIPPVTPCVVAGIKVRSKRNQEITPTSYNTSTSPVLEG